VRLRWLAPSAVALLSLTLVLLWSRMASQALVPPGDSEAAGAAGLKTPADADQTVHKEMRDSAAGGAGRLATTDDVPLVKTAASTRVLPGEVVTYTLTFSNSGDVTRDLDIVGDVLPQDATFKRMITDASDVSGDPDSTTGTIVWSGPFSIDPLAEMVVQYEVTMPLVISTVILVNEGWGQKGAAMVGPDSVQVEARSSNWVYSPVVTRNYSPPRFTVSKSAHPEQVSSSGVEAVFTYTIAFHNEGTMPGVLADIRDTLPTGFEFGGMVAGQSDVDSAPGGATSEITWTGPFSVAGESMLTLVYWVSATPTAGAYTNSATATTVEGKGYPPKTPGQATVHIPYLEEDWQDPSDHWAPYLKHSQLHPDQWFIVPNQGWNGSAALVHTYRAGGKEALDALYTYLGPGTDDWRDYRYEAKVKSTQGEMIGLWFRGKIDEPNWETRHVEGYYFVMRARGDDSFVKLGAIKTNDPPIAHPFEFDNVREIAAQGGLVLFSDQWYTLAVEVRGDHIQCYIDGNLLIDVNDSTYSSGTVGMKTYRIKGGMWDNILVTPFPHP
jgi:uncharacterized repeat protein (TIGR01451 family)